jgi:hypothetical protein
VKIARQQGLEDGYVQDSAMRRPTIAIAGPTFRFGGTVNWSAIMDKPWVCVKSLNLYRDGSGKNTRSFQNH